ATGAEALGGDATAAARVDSAAGRVASGSFGRSGRSSDPAGPSAGTFSEAPALALSATASLPSSTPASSMTAISALFGTVSPSSTRISLSVPSTGDGTSALTLSVMTSSSGSYLATWSPGFLSHLPI